jgi:uncharacterized protein YgbK (DUF1537 family)
MKLGCIADDFTGATDLASTLVRGGMRVVQANGVPHGAAEADIDAVVVALKTRTAPADQAVAQSLAALEWLRGQSANAATSRSAPPSTARRAATSAPWPRP